MVVAFERSPALNAIKTYYLLLLVDEFSYAQIDRILTTLEQRYGEVEENGGNQYLLINLNPI